MKYLLNDGRVINSKTITESLIEFPKYLEIQTCTYCNSNCIVCPYHILKNKISMGKMEYSLWLKIFNEVLDNKDKIINVEPYLNNEPFLDNRIISILSMLKQTNCYIELSSNLQCCSIKQIDEIIEKNLVDEFRCSIFGFNKNTYEKIMGVEMRDVLNKIKYMSDKRDSSNCKMKIQFTMIGHEKLISNEEIKKAEDFSKKINVDFKIYPYLDRAENNTIKTTKLFSQGHKEVIGCKLGYLKDRLAICHDGKVILCCQDWKHQHVLGDLNTISIKKLWNSDKVINYRENIYTRKKSINNLLCEKCALAIVGEKNEKFNC